MQAVIKLLICFTVLLFHGNNTRGQQYIDETFNLVLCEKTIKDKLIADILIIDISRQDSMVATNLLKGDSVILNRKVKYGLLLIGKRKWNYYIELTEYIQQPVREFSLCFNGHATYKRKKRVTDFYVRGGEQVIGSFSKRISKKGKVSRSITDGGKVSD